MQLMKEKSKKKKVLMPAEMHCRHMCCWMNWKKENMMLHLGAVEEMKKKQEPKKDFSAIAMSSDNGIPKTSALNYGIYLMAANTTANISVYFQSATGQNSMSGVI